MPVGTTADYKYVGFFLILGIVFVAVTLGFSYLVRRRARSSALSARETTYECGETTVGATWTQFHVGYYIFALLFVVFDIDTVFLAPWALVLRHLPPGLVIIGLIEGLIFVALLAVGWLYAWKRGVLRWT